TGGGAAPARGPRATRSTWTAWPGWPGSPPPRSPGAEHRPRRRCPVHADAPAVGYVLKMYPRFSDTFVVSEILARAAAGERIVSFWPRRPAHPRFNAALSRVRATVVQIGRRAKIRGAWEVLNAARTALGPAVARHLDELTAAAPDDALQALAPAVHEHGVD